jgi:signal transduction histidine kinase/CheY-like chemotaxis protein
VGRAADEMIGLRGGEALRCLHALDDPRGCGFGPECHHCTVRRTVLDTLETGTSHDQIEAEVTVHYDGQTQDLVMLLSTTRLDLRDEPQVLVSMMDITERKRLEAQLVQAQKMEAVGRLAGGIAHDFNNLLTIINGYSDILLDTLALDDPLAEDLEEIRGAGERAANLTRQLLAFSRRQMLEMKVLDLNTVIEDMAGLLGRIIGEDIELQLRLAPGLPAVQGDAGQMEQVIMNLAVNSRDAMPTGGRLTIQTEHARLEKELEGALGGVGPGDYVTIAVTDTGTGMTAEVQEHLFEPFYTTKEPGKGTGLGLATAYGIVKQSGGEITVSSQAGQGATFCIYLPTVNADGLQRNKASSETAPRGRETVLVVEDDDAVRQLTMRILRQMGYGVVGASGGAEALRYYGKHRRIDLVLTDTVMPEMSGPEMVARLREIDPEIRVLFTSGYTDDTALRHGLDEQREVFIQKPFTRLELARKIRSVLDDAEAGGDEKASQE